MAAETMLVTAALKVLPTPTYTMVGIALACGFGFGVIRLRGLLGVISGAFFALAFLGGYIAYKFFVRG